MMSNLMLKPRPLFDCFLTREKLRMIDYRVTRFRGITEIVILAPLIWGQSTPTLPSQNKILPLARLHPLKKPLFAVVASRCITMGVNDNRGRLYQPLAGFFSFFSQASITQAEKLVFSPFKASCSTCSLIRLIKSCGKRIFFLSDLLFLLPVAIKPSFVKCATTIHETKKIKKVDLRGNLILKWVYTLICTRLAKKTKPRSAGTLTGLLTNNVTESYDMAIYKSTLTHPKFTYLFLAVRRADVTAKPQRAKVTANSEREARLMLVAEYVLFFAGRLPIRGQA